MKRANNTTVKFAIQASVSSQRGFTLLELMVAMAIFAILAVAGWQVFDGVNRARERAQIHADNLAILQYTYLQIQQDMGQIVAYQAPSTDSANISNENTNNNVTNDNVNNANGNSDSGTTPSNIISPNPFMSLDSEYISFVRYADPDPRYQTSASIQRIEYIFDDQRLIRRQHTDIQGENNSNISLDSVLLEGVSAGRWQAYLPELSAIFPSEDSRTINNNENSGVAQNATANTKNPEINLLPRGISIDFTYQEIPITWQWALAPQALPVSNKNGNANDNSANNNSANNNSSNNADSNQDASNPVIDGGN